MGTIQIDGSTPKLTIGNATAEDASIVYDGNAKDFYIALDDSADKLVIGEGSTVGTNSILTITDDSVTIGDAAAVDTKIVFDGNAQDFYVGLDDSADDLVIGLGSTVGTTPAISINSDSDVTISDGAIDFDVASHDTSNGLKLGGTLVTATAAELNIMDGVTSTAAEINLIDGGTARGTTAVASGDGILINDAGTMRMTNVDTVKTFMASGITEVDQWRVTSAFSGSTNPISANWERVDSKGSGYLGTGMSVSSGNWTFPSTGFWVVEIYADMTLTSGTSAWNSLSTKVTDDNSTYTGVSGSTSSFPDASAGNYVHVRNMTIIDVTNTTNIKFYMGFGTANSAVACNAHTDDSITGINFFKLADT